MCISQKLLLVMPLNEKEKECLIYKFIYQKSIGLLFFLHIQKQYNRTKENKSKNLILIFECWVPLSRISKIECASLIN